MRSIMKSLAFAIIVGTAAFLYLALVAAIGNAGTFQASCYGSESGPVTASGEKFEPGGDTAASRTLPFGTRLLVRHGTRSVAVTVNDYGPAEWTGRDLDLAMGACQSIGLDGVGAVEVSEVPSSTSHEKLPETGIAK